ncbi:MAG: hypothetical protein B7Z20_02905 [Sphingobium sp. 32-64-5]|nr:MAG: hypothetical protein B7Z20_02905 [Sphingobium sp. 32-64-5]
MKHLPRPLLPLAALTGLALGLSACASPENRLRTRLIDAGLPDRTASCMAEYMTDRLSLTQLRRLQSLASVPRVDYRRITLAEYLHKVRALQDAELIAVTGKAALRCAF